MWRIMGLALLYAVAVAVPVAAEESRQAVGDTARLGAHRTATGSEAQPADAEQAVVVKLPVSPFLASPSLRPSAPKVPWLAVGVAGLASARQEPRPRLVLPWLSQGLAVPLTERFSLGVDYQNIRGEDLWRQFAETGSLDYDSHNFILRAHWRF
jgi:hypothetical protein